MPWRQPCRRKLAGTAPGNRPGFTDAPLHRPPTADIPASWYSGVSTGMANLRHLNLAGNRWGGLLSHAWFAPGVTKWTNLKVLDLSNNPLSNGGNYMDLPPSFAFMSLVELRVSPCLLPALARAALACLRSAGMHARS